MTAEVPIPEEFRGRPDDYEAIPDMFVEADYYRDGELLHSTVHRPVEQPIELQPGWTVQGGPRAS